MSTISYVGPSREQVYILGIGEGENLGKISITWGGRRLELINLTIERHLPCEEVAKRVASEMRMLQWVPAETKRETLFVEKTHLEEALMVDVAGAEHPWLCDAISRLFPSLAIANSYACSARFAEVYPCSLRSAMQVEAMRPLSLEYASLDKEEYLRIIYDRINNSVGWVERHLMTFLSSVAWAAKEWVKVPGVSVPIICWKDCRTGEISVDITLGIFEYGAKRNSKKVIRIVGGRVYSFSHVVPQKKSPLGARLSAYDVAENRELICREAGIVEEFIRGGVPRVIHLRDCRLEQDGETKHRYLMKGYNETFLEYGLRMRYERPFGDARVALGLGREALFFLLQLLDTLGGIHAFHWVHRDLYPGNVFLKGGKIHVGGFSYSKLAGESAFPCGTPGYIAPEVLFFSICTSANPASDMWSFGVILYECTHDQLSPFKTTQAVIMEKIASYKKFVNMLREEADRSLFQQDPGVIESLQQEYQRRLSACERELMKTLHPYLKDLEQSRVRLLDSLHHPSDALKMLLRELFSRVPSERPTALQAFDRLREILSEW